jgi:putative ABC transport system ATP-binding protein
VSEPLVRLEQVSKSYGDGKSIQAVRDVNFEIGSGERVAVMGPSGSGKSTLLNLMCGLDEPTKGSVLIDGVDLSKLDDDARTRLRRQKIGMIFQTFNLLPTFSGLENIAFPLRLQGMKRGPAEERARTMLARVGLTDRAAHMPDEMSGGERQRIAIARAIVFEPPLLLADEPTGNLDSATGEEVLLLLDELNQQFNTTILLVTHNPLTTAHCDRLITIFDGVVTHDGRLDGASDDLQPCFQPSHC